MAEVVVVGDVAHLAKVADVVLVVRVRAHASSSHIIAGVKRHFQKLSKRGLPRLFSNKDRQLAHKRSVLLCIGTKVHTQTHRHTHTDTYTHTHTQTQTHTDTHRHTYTHSARGANTSLTSSSIGMTGVWLWQTSHHDHVRTSEWSSTGRGMALFSRSVPTIRRPWSCTKLRMCSSSRASHSGLTHLKFGSRHVSSTKWPRGRSFLP